MIEPFLPTRKNVRLSDLIEFSLNRLSQFSGQLLLTLPMHTFLQLGNALAENIRIWLKSRQHF